MHLRTVNILSFKIMDLDKATKIDLESKGKEAQNQSLEHKG